MPGTDAIETYLNKIDDPAKRQALEDLRSLIKKAAPDAEEAPVYGVPGFKLNGQGLVCYAAFKAHCGFYPMSPELMDKMTTELEGLRVAKGTIHFTPDQPLDESLVERIVTARVAEIAAGKKA